MAKSHTLQLTQSQQLLQQALEIIPLAAQTFSKSYLQFPNQIAPHFVSKAKGSIIYDVDGNQYVDFVNGLLSVVLGYADPDVNQAVMQQLNDGVSFSLPHHSEIKLAEIIISMVPCAEMVRFVKNGSDATSAAIRLARAYTQRDHIAMCGYHGWQDWSMANTSKSEGIPAAVSALSHRFEYNNIDSLATLFDQYPQQIAAVILEPMNSTYPENNFLNQVADLARKHGAILVFDEVITGFRFSLGGAQELFNVTPDLCCLGKGLANGFPISALAGKKELMKGLSNVFVSTTFGGDAMSIAAAIATLNKLQQHKVPDYLANQGEQLQQSFNMLIKKYQLEHLISLVGHPSWSMLQFHDTDQFTGWQVKTFILQSLIEQHILSLGSHNISYAHTEHDIRELMIAYERTFSELQECVTADNLLSRLRCEPLQPIFAVR